MRDFSGLDWVIIGLFVAGLTFVSAAALLS
jgi:hypothetical protein